MMHCLPQITGDEMSNWTLLFQVSLSRLKETVAPSDCDRTPDTRLLEEYYPFATVLRLRVLQVIIFNIILET